MKKIRLFGIGCGVRTRIYMQLASRHPERFEIVGAADPIAERQEELREACGHPPHFKTFRDDREVFAQPRLADVVIIGTQDHHHVEPCLRAMNMGYDVLLEKPIAPHLDQVIALDRAARDLGRRVLVGHVLRYTPFYHKVKEIIDSGVLGEVVSVDATEGVGTFHQAHSFIRGNWSVVEKSSPMILGKSCHDLDIISWLVDRPCRQVASFGSLQHFRPECAPAGAPERCSDGCPVGDVCHYNALRYLRDKRDLLARIFPRHRTAQSVDIFEWLKVSPWGRCVYHCDNTAVDRQVAAFSFADGRVATFTMTGFDSGRNLTVCGTQGTLRGGDFLKNQAGNFIVVSNHGDGSETKYSFQNLPTGRSGGDEGLVDSLHRAMTGESLTTSLPASVESHVMGYAAEEARLTGTAVDVAAYRARHDPGPDWRGFFNRMFPGLIGGA